jgi:hypothetical protein
VNIARFLKKYLAPDFLVNMPYFTDGQRRVWCPVALGVTPDKERKLI